MLLQTAQTSVKPDEDEQLLSELNTLHSLLSKYDKLAEKERAKADKLFPDYALTLFHGG